MPATVFLKTTCLQETPHRKTVNTSRWYLKDMVWWELYWRGGFWKSCWGLFKSLAQLCWTSFSEMYFLNVISRVMWFGGLCWKGKRHLCVGGCVAANFNHLYNVGFIATKVPNVWVIFNGQLKGFELALVCLLANLVFKTFTMRERLALFCSLVWRGFETYKYTLGKQPLLM